MPDQQKGRSLVFREGGDGGLDRGRCLGPRSLMIRAIRFRCRGEMPREIFGIKRLRRFALAPPDFVENQIPGDVKQPGDELRLGPVAPGRAPCLDENLLRNILRGGVVTKHSVGMVGHTLPVAGHDFREGGFIAPRGAEH